MLLAFIAVLAGLVLLVWSADRFVDGAASTAAHLGVPAILIGMVIIGFGTSAPELVVSAISASQGNPGIALGNAYGSNITNIALILGLTSVISPITVQSGILRKELPVLTAITALAAWQLVDGQLSRLDAFALLAVFAVLMGLSVWTGMRNRSDPLAREMEEDAATHHLPLRSAVLWLVAGLVLLIISSRLLVWGSVEIARGFGVSDLIIGLTIVAVGTSLPELASSLAAIRKNEHDLALGNVIGSNFFNTLGVVGIAGMLHPLAVEPVILQRDVLLMGLLTLSLFVLGWRRHGNGRINRIEGGLLVLVYASYITYLVTQVMLGPASV